MRREPPFTILDATYGNGLFWKGWDGSLGTLHGNDLHNDAGLIKLTFRDLGYAGPAQPSRFFAGDYRDLSMAGLLSTALGFKYDVVVFDPPHWSERGGAAQDGHGTEYYGSTGGGDASEGWDQFFKAADKVLGGDGIIVAKVSDQVHRGVQQLQHVMMILQASSAGFRCCDLIVKTRKAPGPQNWKKQLHTRKVHSFFLCFRRFGPC